MSDLLKDISNVILVLWINPKDGIISRVTTDMSNQNCFSQFIGVGENDCAMENIGQGIYAMYDSNACTLNKEDQHRFTFMKNDFINDIVVWQVSDQSRTMDIQIAPEDAWMLLSNFDTREEGWGSYDEKDQIIDNERNAKLH